MAKRHSACKIVLQLSPKETFGGDYPNWINCRRTMLVKQKLYVFADEYV